MDEAYVAGSRAPAPELVVLAPLAGALLNGLLSLGLGIFFFLAIGNPLQTLWLVGILVGISLFFDGIMLLSLSSAAKRKNGDR